MGSFVGLTAYVWLLQERADLARRYLRVREPGGRGADRLGVPRRASRPSIILAGAAIVDRGGDDRQRAHAAEGRRPRSCCERLGPRRGLSGHGREYGSAGARPVRDPALRPPLDAYLADERSSRSRRPGTSARPQLVDAFLRHDLPLSAGADDLHLTGDVLGQAERLAAELWGADLCRFCSNGSTQGNQALALAAARPGDAGDRRRGTCTSRSSPGSCSRGSSRSGCGPTSTPRPGLALGVPLERIEDALARRARRAGGLPRRAVLRRRRLATSRRSPRLAHARGVPLARRPGVGRALRLPPGAAAARARARRGRDGRVGAQDARRVHAGRVPLRARRRLDLGRAGRGVRGSCTRRALRRDPREPRPARARSWPRAARSSSARPCASPAARARAPAGRGPADRRVRRSDRRRGGRSDEARALAGRHGRRRARGRAGLLGRGRDRLELANRDTLVPLVTIGDTEATRRAARRRAARRRSSGAAASRAGRAARAPSGRSSPRSRSSPREAFFAPRETVAAERRRRPDRRRDGRAVPAGHSRDRPRRGRSAPSSSPPSARPRRDGTRIAYCADPTLATVQVVAAPDLPGDPGEHPLRLT